MGIHVGLKRWKYIFEDPIIAWFQHLKDMNWTLQFTMKNKYWLWYGDLSVLLRSESHLVTKSHSYFFKSHWIEKWEITACYCVTGSVQRDRTWSFKEGLAQLTSWAPIERYSTDTAGSKAIKSLLSNFTSNFNICPSCNKQWIPQFTRISHITYQPTLII